MNATTKAMRKAGKNVVETTAKGIMAEKMLEAQAEAEHKKEATKPVPKLWRAEEIAEHLHMSVSFVYAHISKDHPPVMATQGRIKYYSQEYVDALAAKPLNPRIKRIARIPRKMTHTEGMPKEGSMFFRLAVTEKELAALKEAYTNLLNRLGL